MSNSQGKEGKRKQMRTEVTKYNGNSNDARKQRQRGKWERNIPRAD